jgi:hypothetical protein
MDISLDARRLSLDTRDGVLDLHIDPVLQRVCLSADLTTSQVCDLVDRLEAPAYDRLANETAAAVRDWDTFDVYQLVNMLYALSEYAQRCQKTIADYVSVDQIPSATVPDGCGTIPGLVAADMLGWCLVCPSDRLGDAVMVQLSRLLHRHQEREDEEVEEVEEYIEDV